MIELSRTQDQEVGDGTTSVIILGMFLYDLIENSGFLLYCLLMEDQILIFWAPYLTIFVILYLGAAGEMLHVANAFIDKIHPTVICRGNLFVYY